MTLTNLVQSNVRKARPADIPQIVNVLRGVNNEVDTEFDFEEEHAWGHVTGIVCNGVSFVAEINDVIVGVLMCGYVDIGFAQTEHLETIHWYVVPDARSTGAASLLLEAIEAEADERKIVVIFHQADYHSALNGKGNNSKAVERAYRLRRYEGPLDIATVGHDGRRVGVSYRYPPRT